jgi:hypothetical protein
LTSPFGPMSGVVGAECFVGLRFGVEEDGAPPPPVPPVEVEGVVGFEVVGELLGIDVAELLRRRSSICKARVTGSEL